MEEIGVDISKQYSKSLEEFRGERFDYVVTVCDYMKEVRVLNSNNTVMSSI